MILVQAGCPCHQTKRVKTLHGTHSMEHHRMASSSLVPSSDSSGTVRLMAMYVYMYPITSADVSATDTLTLLIKVPATVTFYAGHRRTLCRLPTGLHAQGVLWLYPRVNE